jgi:fatty-acyl-CoA synthase
VVILGGESIPTIEVEQALMSQPAVLKVAVIGYRTRSGASGRKRSVAKEGYMVGEHELIDHVRIKIARYKAPPNVDFLLELTKTSTGTVQKFALRDAQWAGNVLRVQG